MDRPELSDKVERCYFSPMKFDFTALEWGDMSKEQRCEILAGSFGRWKMEQAARYIAAFWWVEPRQSRVLVTAPGIRVRNGTAFFAEINGKLLCITAAHVYREFLEAKRHYPRLRCQLGEGDFAFDPEPYLCSIGGEVRGVDKVDIATFQLPPEILPRINKEAIVVREGAWPPPHPFTGQQSTVIGFPASTRLWTGPRAISFGIYCGSPSIGGAGDRQITMPFERDHWVPSVGLMLPPEGLDLGGMSGGPVLMLTEKDNDWSYIIGGVISEMPQSRDYELIIAEPAHFIAPDGTILDERSAPLRHYVPAKR